MWSGSLAAVFLVVNTGGVFYYVVGDDGQNLPSIHQRCRAHRWGSITALVGILGWGISSQACAVGAFSLAPLSMAVDYQRQRLPIVVTNLLIFELLISAGTKQLDPEGTLLTGLEGAALWWGLLFVSHWGPGRIGRGDLRLAIPLGFLLGFSGLAVAAFGLLTTMIMAAVMGIICLVRDRNTSVRFAFGPFLWGGALATWAAHHHGILGVIES